MRALIYRPLFPYHRHSKKRLVNQVMLGIGGNVGNCVKRFETLLRKIFADSRFCILSTSPIYRNPAFGYTQQADFYNATVQISTNCGLIEVFRMIFYWERCFGRGRKREFKNAPRTLDIDLLWFNQLQLKRDYLKIPHPFWHERESVLIPLQLQNII